MGVGRAERGGRGPEPYCPASSCETQRQRSEQLIALGHEGGGAVFSPIVHMKNMPFERASQQFVAMSFESGQSQPLSVLGSSPAKTMQRLRLVTAFMERIRRCFAGTRSALKQRQDQHQISTRSAHAAHLELAQMTSWRKRRRQRWLRRVLTSQASRPGVAR